MLWFVPTLLVEIVPLAQRVGPADTLCVESWITPVTLVQRTESPALRTRLVGKKMYLPLMLDIRTKFVAARSVELVVIPNKTIPMTAYENLHRFIMPLKMHQVVIWFPQK